MEEALDRAVTSVPDEGSSRPDRSTPIGRPDLVWIVADTLRADASGLAGGALRSADPPGPSTDASSTTGRSTPTPNLDRLASGGVVFARAIAPAPWTLPSMWSLLTGRHPSTLDPIGRGAATDIDRLPRLDPGVPTWIEALRSIGYRTVGFQKNPFLARGSGIESAFDVYRSVGGDRAERHSGAQLTRAALRWATLFAQRRAQGDRDPYLLYVHFMDPHIDYRAPKRFWSEAARAYPGPVDGTAKDLHARLEAGAAPQGEDREQLRRLYAAEVAYLDARVEQLLEGLRERGLLDDSSLVVFSSDHGEQFGEHGGWEHGDLHRENVHVPWVLAGAGLIPQRIETPVSAMDLGPTILELLGAPDLVGAEGRSRAALLLEPLSARSSLSGLRPPRPAQPEPQPALQVQPLVTEYGRAIRWEEWPWVLIENADGRRELYDVSSDPDERQDRAADHPDRVAGMRERVAAHRSRPAARARGGRPRDPLFRRELDPKTLEALRALGYGR